ncbi:MAG: type II toxin-antitoxin system RelE/ParE family toxin [Candidatus Binataceae bacterium]
MILELHAEAIGELEAEIDWYEARTPGLGEAFLREVSRALDVIAASPRMWPVWPQWRGRTSVRRFVLARFPFSIAFLTPRGRVVVVAIAHGRRRPGYCRGRLRQ